MSFENQYPGPAPLNDVAALCEAVLSKEDWDNLPADFDYWSIASVQICEQLRKGFEDKYQVVQQPEALRAIQENPASLSYITLDNPRLTIPNSLDDNTDHHVFITDKISLAYSTVILQETFYQDAPPYKGPHVAVVLDTSCLDPIALAATELKPGFYTGIIPFRIAQVPDDYIPHKMN